MDFAQANARRTRCGPDRRTIGKGSLDGFHAILRDPATSYWLTAARAIDPCPSYASPYRLDDHGALELGKDAAHLIHRLTRWRACIDALQMQVKISGRAVYL